MKTTSALPAEPVVEVVVLSEPPDAAHVIATPGTRLPKWSKARTVSSVLAPATSDVESAVPFARLAAGPGVVVAVTLTVPVPAVAVSTLTRTVSLSVHVTLAFPFASVVDVALLTTPLLAFGNQVTVTFAAGSPPSSTWTVVAKAEPIGAVRAVNEESAETLYAVCDGPPGPVPPGEPSDDEPQAVAAAKGRARRKNRRMRKRHSRVE